MITSSAPVSNSSKWWFQMGKTSLYGKALQRAVVCTRRNLLVPEQKLGSLHARSPWSNESADEK